MRINLQSIVVPIGAQGYTPEQNSMLLGIKIIDNAIKTIQTIGITHDLPSAVA